MQTPTKIIRATQTPLSPYWARPAIESILTEFSNILMINDYFNYSLFHTKGNKKIASEQKF